MLKITPYLEDINRKKKNNGLQTINVTGLFNTNVIMHYVLCITYIITYVGT